jgi:transcription elongation GreA/GreB family factor
MTAYVRSLAARFVRRRQTERELDEELAAHIRLHAERLERAGLDRPEAERRARIEFGSTARFKEECRE